MFPHERSLVERLKDKPFALIGIDSDENLAQLRPHLEEEKITWRSFWCGKKGTFGAIPGKWNVHGWPTLYVIDAKGVIRFKSVGAKEKEMDAVIEGLLADMEGGGAKDK